MPKRVQIALAVALIILAGVSAWQRLRDREPVYQGKPLSIWLKANQSVPARAHAPNFVAESDAQSQKADEAVRQAGTNALPTLLRMLRAKDSALKVKLMALAERQHFIKIKYTPAKERNHEAIRAFRVLGAKAKSAVPALIEIANRNISRESQSSAVAALAYIGPSAKEAAPDFLRWATNADRDVRFCAIAALGKTGNEPDPAVPVLVNTLHDPQPLFRFGALLVLRDFGPNAKLAVPALLEFLNRHDDYMNNRELAADVLKAIDPEAAAKAGVK
jgi:hypothetical protein